MKLQIGLLLFIFTGLVACKSVPVDVSPLPIEEKEYKTQEAQLQKTENLLLENKIYDAEAQFRDFVSKHPQSVFYLRANLGLAKALEQQGRWLEAIEIYKQVLRASQGANLKIAALAMYNLSFCYDSIGDHGMTLATLKDAEKMKADLPQEIALAEIPARLAAHYYRVGLTQEATKYFHQAEKGVAMAYSKDDPQSKELKAKSFYQMGSLSSSHISYENLQGHLETISLMQVFTLRAIEVEHPIWSSRALQGLVGNYRDIWQAILSIPTRQGLDPGAANKVKIDTQLRWAGQVLKTLAILKQYGSPEELSKEKQFSWQLAEFVSAKDKEINEFLTSAADMTPLTAEAKKRQSLKREGITQSEPVFPAEKKAVKNQKEEETKKEDPNL